MHELTVALGERSYPIFIGRDLLQNSTLWCRYIRGRQVMVVTNETIAPLYLDSLKQALDGYQVSTVVLPDGEQYKNSETLNRIFDRLLVERHNRTTTLIALGGGVIGDMTGFAAACYQRGVDFIQIPTTLLSQVDSSVGGKTGVNHPLGKNMIGAFHQPRCVVIDTDTLQTLPGNELSAGLAEVIKYGLTFDHEFLGWLEANLNGLIEYDPDLLAQAILTSCRIKAKVVEEDEKERGIRALLNLGHTFGHAIESHTGYGSWLHGEAIAAGTMMAADLSRRLGWLSGEDVERIRQLYVAAKLPVSPPEDMSPEHFMGLMAVDKKVIDGRLRLVLLKRLGQGLVTDEFPAEQLQDTLKSTFSA
jgi:3-dehydroquinate synthase